MEVFSKGKLKPKWKMFLGLAVFAVLLILSGSLYVNAQNDGAGIIPSAPHHQKSSPPPSATVPRPVAVTISTGSTALLLLDFTNDICGGADQCVDTIPAVVALATEAQSKGVMIVCSMAPIPGDAIMSQIAPFCTGSHTVVSGPDKFFNTNLASILGTTINTVVITGTASNGAVLYTSFHANELGYTAVVAEDGISNSVPYAYHFSLYQLLNVPVYSNPTNIPLQLDAVTLSTTTQITFS
jgi:nicotinamidase-related amidase